MTIEQLVKATNAVKKTALTSGLEKAKEMMVLVGKTQISTSIVDQLVVDPTVFLNGEAERIIESHIATALLVGMELQRQLNEQ